MGTYMFEADEALFAKQLRQLGVNLTWVGSPTTVSVTALKLAGPALYGSYAVTDFNRDSSEAAKAFATKYEAAYKTPADFFGAWSYDAVHVLARAIDQANSLEPEKLRQAILSVKGYAGAVGIYNFDKNGDGLHGYNVVKNNNGVWCSTGTSISTIDLRRHSGAQTKVCEPGMEWSRSHDDAAE
jgi:branched-chain amino acid transport system substrate-binding protein